MRFPMHIDSISRARHFVRSVLPELPDETVRTAELLTSELATNAIVHGHTAFDIEVTTSGPTVRVAVTDQCEQLPVLLSPDPSDVHGRGLLILERLASRWGTAGDGPGKTVWFDLVAPP
jgi:anti-sigma regulatory factor (Ser/Thr protein kinase)